MEEAFELISTGAWSIVPPLLALALALITKEVYSSLTIGVFVGMVIYQFTLNGVGVDQLVTAFTDVPNAMALQIADNGALLLFLALLGALTVVIATAGGSRAYAEWVSTHIKNARAAQVLTGLLGIIIFVDDYFNCLTVGSVMRPVTDRQKVSRAKLAYLIDATAAPICIIAPVSSWAAAVTSSVPEGSGINGFTMFLRTIPYNYYAILTMVMSLFLIFSGLDYGPMKKHEDNAILGDLFTTEDRPYGDDVDDSSDTRGHVVDLIAPVLVLIAACIFGMVYTGGFFEGVDFITAFANCSASVGLVMGSAIALMFTFVFYRVRGVMTFQDFAACIPEGFKAMVSPMLILTLAWTLSGMTGLLGANTTSPACSAALRRLCSTCCPSSSLWWRSSSPLPPARPGAPSRFWSPSSATPSRMVRCWWSPSPPACPARSAATTARPSPTPPSWPLPARIAAT